MKILHTFKGILKGEEKTITEDCQISPNSGYGQDFADRSGKSYENGRAEELLGEYDYWQHVSSQYLR